MKSQLVRLSIFGLVIVALVIGMAVGIVVDRHIAVAASESSPISAAEMLNSKLMDEAISTIQRVFVDQKSVDANKLTYGAISGIVDALGDTGHSRFLSPQMVRSETRMTQGSFEGIGAQLQTKEGAVVIVAPMDDSPAKEAGLRAGDIIVKLNGETLADVVLEQVVERILGPAGTKITLTIMNPNNGNLRDVSITRRHITLHNVTWQVIPGTTIAHLRLSAFSQGVSEEFKQALQQIQQQQATGIILDLRNNPGGLVSELVSVGSQLLPTGNILQIKNAQGQISPMAVKGGGIAYDIPMAVLINEGTASAGEIISGAIQDAHRAPLIGKTTFGTGTVLEHFPLSDGSALLLATQEWLTPSGRVIWHQGIVPDQVVALPAAADLLLPAAEKSMTAEQVKASKDAQFQAALKVLTQAPAKKPDSANQMVIPVAVPAK